MTVYRVNAAKGKKIVNGSGRGEMGGREERHG
jgi:hypothetical protein